MSGVQVPSPPPFPVSRLLAILAGAIETSSLAERGILVAFSGGPDSTALLAGLALSADRYALRLHAMHLDHQLDPDSRRRASCAEQLAAAIGVPLERLTVDVAAARRRGESTETAARRVRYAQLAATAERLGGSWIVTAHHRDDQAETVLQRLAMGTGLFGLAGIAKRRGPIVRPLLDATRAELAAAVTALGLAPVIDPTNRDLAHQRNRFRHGVLPRLAAAGGADEPSSASDLPAARSTAVARIAPGSAALPAVAALGELELLHRQLGTAHSAALACRLANLAATARQTRVRVTARLLDALAPITRDGALHIPLANLLAVPAALRPFALVTACEQLGERYPPTAGASEELTRQLATRHAAAAAGLPPGRLGIDLGNGLLVRASGEQVVIAPTPPRRPRRRSGDGREIGGPVTYTLRVPGIVDLPDLGCRMRLSEQPLADWMFAGDPQRAALALPLGVGDEVEVRGRRPGDRLRPFGSDREQRLKDLLINRRIPRDRRDTLALLVVDGHVAWVPGVTIDDRFRLPPPASLPVGPPPRIWVAEVLPR